MKSYIHIIMLSFVLVFSFSIYSQEYEWGEITDEEFAMTSIEEDPDADAVILFDIAQISITPDFELNFKRHVRIKILTEEGKEHANVNLYYPRKYDIYELEAQSFLPNGDDFELDDDNIFEESVPYLHKKVFAIPGVEVGSVLEYRYELFSESIHYLQPWYFQNDIFTKLSEISVYLPTGFNYNAFKENTTNYDIEHYSAEDWDPYQSGKRTTKYIWKGKNLPPIKSEPYMNNLEDYIAKLSFQLISFKNRYVSYTFIKTWDDLANTVRDDHTKLLDKDDGVAELKDSLITDSMQVNDKINILYDFVRKNIETISTDEFEPPEELLENKKGDRVEKNLLLISLLRKAGIEAYPVLISTRKNGKFSPKLTQLRQFNHTIVCVNSGDKYLFLDTIDKNCPFGMLPVNSSVKKGFIIKDDKGQVINISQAKLNNQVDINSIVNLKDDGEISVESNIKYEGYVALRERKSLNKTDEEEFIKEKLEDYFTDAEIDTFEISNNEELEKPLEVFIKFRVKNYAQIIGDMIYLPPPFLAKFENNPFTSKKRYFPVDYSYTYNSSQKTKINFPPSFTISEIPKKGKANMQKISFITIYFKDQNSIEVNRRYRRRRDSVHHSEYQDLLNFYDRVVESDQSQIVFQKL